MGWWGRLLEGDSFSPASGLTEELLIDESEVGERGPHRVSCQDSESPTGTLATLDDQAFGQSMGCGLSATNPAISDGVAFSAFATMSK